nr:hypothetical protein [Actinomycetospora corticicola]
MAGLAREVDGLRRAVTAVTGVPARVDDLARTLAQLADAVTATPTRPGPVPAPSWLAAPREDPEQLAALLGALGEWLGMVFLRYPDASSVLPECWLWHPDVVEELLWLWQAWIAAYEAKGASVQLAGDWHDRQRPGVVRRLKAAVGSCSIERHQTRTGWNERPRSTGTVPGLDAIAQIADWWGTARDQPAPEPSGSSSSSIPGFLGAGPGTGTGRRR